MVCDSPAMVRLLVLMAAVWIDGFVNGQRSDRQTFNSVSIYNRSNVPKKGGWGEGGRKKKSKYNNKSN